MLLETEITVSHSRSDTQTLFGTLRSALGLQPTPIIIARETCPGASLWTGGIAVKRALQALGIGPGHRVVAQLPNGVAFVHLMLGCIRIGATFCPIPVGLTRNEAEVRAKRLGAAVFVGSEDDFFLLKELKLPVDLAAERQPVGAESMIFWTSGSSSDQRPIAIAEAQLLHQINAHTPLLNLDADTTVVSYLSWAHAFGGVLELLVSLCAGAVIEVPCPEKFDLSAIARAIRAAEAPALFTVPKVLAELLKLKDGRELVGKLRDGIVGGAPLDEALAGQLRACGSQIRVGYGQTECSPGISLGPRGEFSAGFLGNPVGCEMRLSEQGEIEVRGSNVVESSVEWWPTGDLARQNSDGSFSFEGRVSRCWKWSNGRMYNPTADEHLLSEQLGTTVILLKATDDRAIPVSIGTGAWPLRDIGASAWVVSGIFVSSEVWEQCCGPTGKISVSRLVAHLQGLVALDPLTYSLELALGVGQRLVPGDLSGSRRPKVTPAAWVAIDRSHQFAERAAASDVPIYGWKTGFGPLVKFAASDNPVTQGMSLLCHLQAGQGRDLPTEVVRAMLTLRLHTGSQGLSGISPATVAWLESALSMGLIPVVPSMGSVGASGDLIPMAHAVAAFTGQGQIDINGDRLDASVALSRSGLSPIPLSGRDALALVNGTPLMSAAGSLAAIRFARCLAGATALSGLAFDLLGCHFQPLSSVLHNASGHRTHAEIAGAISTFLSGCAPEGRGRPLQESYSLRCAPQLLGASLTVLRQTLEVLEREINGVTDNPIFDADSESVIHGGNFFGQEVAFSMDHLTNSIVQTGNLVERQLALLVEPSQTDGLPLMLSPNPGANSGLAGVQLCATALVVEMRRTAMPASIQTIPTNGVNQDIVPLGTHAALNALQMVDHLELLIGALALALRQAFYVADREPLSQIGRDLASLFEIPAIEVDRPLSMDVRNAAERVLQNQSVIELAARLSTISSERS